MYAYYAIGDGGRPVVLLVPSSRYPYFQYEDSRSVQGLVLARLSPEAPELSSITLPTNATLAVSVVDLGGAGNSGQAAQVIWLALSLARVNASLPVYVAVGGDSQASMALHRLVLNESSLFVVTLFDIIPFRPDYEQSSVLPIVLHTDLEKFFAEADRIALAAAPLVPLGAFDAVLVDGLNMLFVVVMSFVAVLALVASLGARLVLATPRFEARLRQLLALGMTPLEIARRPLLAAILLSVPVAILLWRTLPLLSVFAPVNSVFLLVGRALAAVSLVATLFTVLLVLAYAGVPRLSVLRRAHRAMSIIVMLALAGLFAMFGFRLQPFAPAALALAGAAVVLAVDGILGLSRSLLRALRALQAALVEVSGPLLVAAVVAVFAVQPVVLSHSQLPVEQATTVLDRVPGVHSLLLTLPRALASAPGENEYIVTGCIVARIGNMTLVRFELVSERSAAGVTLAEVPVIVVGDGVARLLNISGPTLYAGESILSARLPQGILERVSVEIMDSDTLEPTGNLTLERLTVLHEPFPLWMARDDPRGIPATILAIYMKYNNLALVLPAAETPSGCGASLVGIVNPGPADAATGLFLDLDALRESVKSQVEAYRSVSLTPMLVGGLVSLALIVFMAWEGLRSRMLAVSKQLLALGSTPGGIVAGSLVLVALSAILMGAVFAVLSLPLDLPAPLLAGAVLVPVPLVGGLVSALVILGSVRGMEGGER